MEKNMLSKTAWWIERNSSSNNINNDIITVGPSTALSSPNLQSIIYSHKSPAQQERTLKCLAELHQNINGTAAQTFPHITISLKKCYRQFPLENDCIKQTD
jgi:hypothetical protein